MIEIIYLFIVFIVGATFGFIVRSKRVKISEITVETVIDGRTYGLGFRYDHRKDKDEKKFKRMSNELMRSLKCTLILLNEKQEATK